MEQENKKSELRKISNQKYYNKIKQEKQEPQQENKIINNNIECITKEEDWSDWWWETGIGSLKMIGQTLIQSITTITVPAIIMWMIPRTSTPLITSSAQASKQQEKLTQQQPTSLSSL